MEKNYAPQAIENHWYKIWEDAGYFAAQGDGQPYCIMLPPPNITGSLHMGHAFQHTLMDILIRYHRMSGDKTLWQCGTDHAGIATQIVVERQLEQQGHTRHELGREQFTHRVWEWKEKSGSEITRQLRRLGTSMDWERERFTMDQGLSKAVNEVFIRLYKEKLIYRGRRLVNWDPVLQTAISDLEVIATETAGTMWYFHYPLADTDGYVPIATTRPETMLGDAAIAVHPDDSRYNNLIGQYAILPLLEDDELRSKYKHIPIIGDTYVDPDFGTGCVKITPAHDFNDYEVWQRHKDSDVFAHMPMRGLMNVMASDASILGKDVATAKDMDQQDRPTGTGEQTNISDELTDSACTVEQRIPEAYRGLDRYAVRKKIIEKLDAQGYLERAEPHTLMEPRSDRSGAVVEPYLTKQWFVKVQPLAEPAIQAVKQGDIKFVPNNWSKTYFNWMDNIQDWCISRQLWWGHQLPAWYDKDGNVYVASSEKAARKQLCDNPPPKIAEFYGVPGRKLENATLVQDEDVLDTWFSSALWPFSTLGWPELQAEEKQQMKDFYPTNVLVTGFDIIFFWVARMIMMGLKFTGEVPFKEVYIHGLVRDAQGQKMSKSKGNVLDPIDLIDGIDLQPLIKKRTSALLRPQDALKIEQKTRQHFPEGIAAYGTDSLRLTFASLATQSRDVNFDVNRIGGYRHFCNKLWNAARYVILRVENKNIETDRDKLVFGLAERWIMTRLAQTVEQVTKGINDYRFDLAVQAIYEFTWDEYCDWYLEFSKVDLADSHASSAQIAGTHFTLLCVLEILLRLAHPFMPFISEQIWCQIAPKLQKQGKTIMYASYPTADDIIVEQINLEQIVWLKAFILSVRRIRGVKNISPKNALSVSVKGGSKQEQKWLQSNLHYIKSIANTSDIDSVTEVPADAFIELAGSMTLFVQLADIIEPQQELNRLAKVLQKLQKDSADIGKRLDNSKFVERAPIAVVDRERKRLQETKLAVEKLQQQYQRTAELMEK